MPQASQQLRDRWDPDGNGGAPAWAQLGWTDAAARSTRFVNDAGVISPLPGVVPTADDLSAIQYLCDEWDHDYDPKAGFDIAFGKDLNVAVIGLAHDDRAGTVSERNPPAPPS